MTHAKRFLQFVQQRNERAIQDLQVSIRIDEDALVVSERWFDQSAGIDMNVPSSDKEIGGASRECLPIRELP